MPIVPAERMTSFLADTVWIVLEASVAVSNRAEAVLRRYTDEDSTRIEQP